jgi:hypothetical protein
MDHQSYGISLSQETIAKLEELKRLVYKYPQFHNNGPDEIVGYAAYWALNDDNKFLDEMLEQLRTIDSYQSGIPYMRSTPNNPEVNVKVHNYLP